MTKIPKKYWAKLRHEVQRRRVERAREQLIYAPFVYLYEAGRLYKMQQQRR